MIIHFK